tara:strand:- start:1946 stop:2752 length:807 start_codon:yes stop_codon:yes gene_type:complete
MNIKKYLITAMIIGLLPLLSLAQGNHEKVTIPLSKPNSAGILHVSTHNGTVTVEGYSGTQVEVSMTAKEDDHNSGKYAKQGLKKIANNSMDITIREEDNEVNVKAGHNKNVDLVIKVPTNFSLDINTHHNGAISVSNVKGEITTNAHHGGITIHNVTGSVIADTHHGEIEVTFDGVTSGKTMAFSTYHGDVDVTFPSSIVGDVKIKSSKGEIFTDFDIALKKPEMEKKTGNNGAKEIKLSGWTRGSIGSGGPELMFTTYHGDVVIRKK